MSTRTSSEPVTEAVGPAPPVRVAVTTADSRRQGVPSRRRRARRPRSSRPPRILDRAGFAIDTITGVDWIAQNEMEVVYDFFHPVSPSGSSVRARVPRAEPELPTISAVYPGANWHEREAHDFFGIRFAGHPNLTPLLLPEDADYHPLRKDYQP